ncbi:protocadherin-16-like [Columba livia]|uniref:Protocadherin-16-like n=1 Tax=Columba livia TaxID=8932 RepID=A0A2I0LQT8_COLLI|nr:protocadherin-16-like [Columba livia]
MAERGVRWSRWERALLWGVLVAAWEAAWGQLHYSIPEEMPKGSFVGDVATDLRLQLPALSDSGVRILDKGRMQYFALHGKTGHLVTAERIDREQLCESVQQCVLRCEVIVEGKMNIYGIEVEIMDVNDNSPSFREVEKELRMSETTAPGSRFPLTEAHDPDSGPNSVQSYELSGDEHFSLAIQTGPGGDQRPELVLAKALDREEAAFHELMLRASDGGEPAQTGTARIRVAVLDANDNAPVFSQAEYTVRVPEDVPVGSTLVTVTATDPDEGLNGHMKFSLQKVSVKASLIFQLDAETGEITLVKSLDFEESDSYEMEVQAEDGGGLFDTVKFVITVTDVNDNAPRISIQSVLSEISEDAPSGTMVALLHVQDRDSGPNGKVQCSITDSLPFRLEKSFENYYRVVTAEELDREQVSEYNVTVRAADGGSPALWSSAVLWLRVLDVNDNVPVFAEARYSARVPENNAAGALVLRVRAWDADWGQNARVRYRLGEGRVRGAPLSSYVSVEAETGALYALRSFDYEEVREVGLWVRAEDGGAPALSSNVSVRLVIVDENDNAPQVLYPPALLAAGSGALRGVPASHFVGIDGVRAFLHSYSHEVSLTADSRKSQLRFSGASCCDTLPARPPAETSGGLVPTGDHAAGNGEQVSFQEVRSRTFGLSPSSLDAAVLKHGLRVSLLAKEEKRLPHRLLQYPSEKQSMEARPTAQGRAAAGRVALLAVLLLPVCCRELPERLRYTIPEELGRGSLVGPLARDLGLRAADLPARKLRIVSSDEKQYFALGEDKTNLRVNERIDREGICGAVSPCVLSLEAVVENPFNIFHVSITIQDINDNAPQFDRDIFAIEIIESTPPGVRFPLGRGRDPDIGANSLQNYQLTPNPIFSLVVRESPDGTKHAELVLEKNLDREKQRNHNLILTAVDGGDPVRSGTAQIKINVTDANDNPPVFTKEVYKVRLLEDLPEGSLAFQVKATDSDEGTNAEITYSFSDIANSARQLFSLDSMTGHVKITGPLDYEEEKYYEMSVEGKDGGGLSAHAKVHIDIVDNTYKLITASALDREKVSAYNITVTARDRGRPTLSSSTVLVLEVSDVNDNAPVFEEAAYSAYVAENNAAGAPVLRVLARDADAGANGRVSYWLSGGSADAAAYVSVEARSGALYAQRSFDYEQCREFAVVVRAQDGGEPARSSTATVRVFVLDRNDNAPRVLWPAPEAGERVPGSAPALEPFEVVPRSAEAGYLVAKVVAVDADAGRNAWLSYELVQAAEPALFRVGLHSGERLSVAGAAFPADFCEGTLPYSYNLCVAPGRAVAEAAWLPPPLPSLPAEELLGGEPSGKRSPKSSAGAGEPPADPDEPQVCQSPLSRVFP